MRKKPSTRQILYCLAEMPGWCAILVSHRANPYNEFLAWLIQKKFFDEEKRISITHIAKEFGAKPAHATKWIVQIYADIFDLNEEEPLLFKSEGPRHNLRFCYRDRDASLHIWLPVTPRVHERFRFWFIKAKVGVDYFYVNDTEHEIIRGEQTIQVNLVGGFLNRYRELLVDRAYFENRIDFSTHRNPSTWGLDDTLKKWYRS